VSTGAAVAVSCPQAPIAMAFAALTFFGWSAAKCQPNAATAAAAVAIQANSTH
jgi:hypothetical protein